MGRSGNPAKRAWEPLRQTPVDPAFIEAHRQIGDSPPTAVWSNRIYEVLVYELDGLTHLSIKRYDRAAVRDWRHFQQIKNEVCGPEREGCEIYPAESRIADNANQYHVYVLPEGTRFPFGFGDRKVSPPEAIEEWNRVHGGKGKQRPWQPGLTTGNGGKA